MKMNSIVNTSCKDYKGMSTRQGMLKITGKHQKQRERHGIDCSTEGTNSVDISLSHILNWGKKILLLVSHCDSYCHVST